MLRDLVLKHHFATTLTSIAETKDMEEPGIRSVSTGRISDIQTKLPSHEPQEMDAQAYS